MHPPKILKIFIGVAHFDTPQSCLQLDEKDALFLLKTHRVAPIHPQRNARDVFRRVGRQKQSRFANVRRFAQETHRRA
jgi:hypothetical protein